MSTGLLATGRITIPYTVSSLTHKFRVYVRGLTATGGTFNINSRATDANDTVWTDAAHDLAQSFSWLMPTGWSMADAILEKLVGGIWLVQATATLTITDHASGSAGLGWQDTFVARDINFKKVKFVILDLNQSTLLHTVNLAGLGGSGAASFSKEFTSSKTLTNAPYNWVVGRGNQYLNTASFVGYTRTTNRRIRRRRGLT